MTEEAALTRLETVSQRLIETVAALGGTDQQHSLELIVEVAHAQVAAADSVSLTTLRNGHFATTIASDDLARRGDELQYSLLSGPSIDAIRDGAIYHPTNLPRDPRWPIYGQRAADELGIHSMLSYRLYTGTNETVESLNFYSCQPNGFNPEDLLTGLLFATQAALTIATAKTGQFKKALETSREIGAATGILMANHKVTLDQAFGLLRVASQNLNLPLRDIAAEVVHTGTLEIPRPTPKRV